MKPKNMKPNMKHETYIKNTKPKKKHGTKNEI